MNLEQLQAMSDAELNELSAVKVMGWTENEHPEVNGTGQWMSEYEFPVYFKQNGYFILSGKWNPTTDMNDAMELIYKLHQSDWILRELRHYVDKFGGGKFNRFHCLLMQIETGATRTYTDEVSFSRAITIASILAKEGTE